MFCVWPEDGSEWKLIAEPVNHTRKMDHGAFKGKPHTYASAGAAANVNVDANTNGGSSANSNMNSTPASTVSTSASTTLNSNPSLSTGTIPSANNTYVSPSQQQQQQQQQQQANRGKKFSWVKRLMNNNAMSAEPVSLVPAVASGTGHRHQQAQDHNRGQNRQQQPHLRSQKKSHKGTDGNIRPKTKSGKTENHGNVVLRKPLVQEPGNAGKLFQFNDVTSIENDEIVSYVSSNVSLKLQDSYDRQFYMRQDGYDANTSASVKSIFSGNPAPSIYSNGAVSVNTTGTNNNRSSFGPAPMTHINPLHPTAHSHSHGHGHNHNHLNASTNTNTHNNSMQLHPNNGTSYSNYLDSASTFSGSAAEDNVSTRPLVSFSSDEEDEDNDDDADDDDGSNGENEEQDSAHTPAERFKHGHGHGHHVQIAENTLTAKEVDSILDSNENSDKYFPSVATATADGADNDVGGYIQVHSDTKELDERHDDFDESSFEVKSKYPSSTKSTAVTSMSVLTSPVLTTINSSTTTATTMTNNTTNTNVATAASVMTLASSSRHVYNV